MADLIKGFSNSITVAKSPLRVFSNWMETWLVYANKVLLSTNKFTKYNYATKCVWHNFIY